LEKRQKAQKKRRREKKRGKPESVVRLSRGLFILGEKKGNLIKIIKSGVKKGFPFSFPCGAVPTEGSGKIEGKSTKEKGFWSDGKRLRERKGGGAGGGKGRGGEKGVNRVREGSSKGKEHAQCPRGLGLGKLWKRGGGFLEKLGGGVRGSLDPSKRRTPCISDLPRVPVGGGCLKNKKTIKKKKKKVAGTAGTVHLKTCRKGG